LTPITYDRWNYDYTFIVLIIPIMLLPTITGILVVVPCSVWPTCDALFWWAVTALFSTFCYSLWRWWKNGLDGLCLQFDAYSDVIMIVSLFHLGYLLFVRVYWFWWAFTDSVRMILITLPWVNSLIWHSFGNFDDYCWLRDSVDCWRYYRRCYRCDTLFGDAFVAVILFRWFLRWWPRPPGIIFSGILFECWHCCLLSWLLLPVPLISFWWLRSIVRCCGPLFYFITHCIVQWYSNLMEATVPSGLSFVTVVPLRWCNYRYRHHRPLFLLPGDCSTTLHHHTICSSFYHYGTLPLPCVIPEFTVVRSSHRYTFVTVDYWLIYSFCYYLCHSTLSLRAGADAVTIPRRCWFVAIPLPRADRTLPVISEHYGTTRHLSTYRLFYSRERIPHLFHHRLQTTVIHFGYAVDFGSVPDAVYLPRIWGLTVLRYDCTFVLPRLWSVDCSHCLFLYSILRLLGAEFVLVPLRCIYRRAWLLLMLRLITIAFVTLLRWCGIHMIPISPANYYFMWPVLPGICSRCWFVFVADAVLSWNIYVGTFVPHLHDALIRVAVDIHLLIVVPLIYCYIRSRCCLCDSARLSICSVYYVTIYGATVRFVVILYWCFDCDWWSGI